MKEFLTSGIVGYIQPNKEILTKDYKEFKETDFGKEQIEIYLKRWSDLGLIEGLEGDERERCALAMEQLAQHLVFEACEDDSITEFEVIGFPMIRRIIAPVTYSGFNKLNNPDSFSFEKFIKYCEELNINALREKIEKEIKAFHNIDVDAEACAIGCEAIIDRLNGDERSFDELVDNKIKKILKK